MIQPVKWEKWLSSTGNSVGNVIQSVKWEKWLTCRLSSTGKSVGHLIQPITGGNIVEMSHISCMEKEQEMSLQLPYTNPSVTQVKEILLLVQCSANCMNEVSALCGCGKLHALLGFCRRQSVSGARGWPGLLLFLLLRCPGKCPITSIIHQFAFVALSRYRRVGCSIDVARVLILSACMQSSRDYRAATSSQC